MGTPVGAKHSNGTGAIEALEHTAAPDLNATGAAAGPQHVILPDAAREGLRTLYQQATAKQAVAQDAAREYTNAFALVRAMAGISPDVPAGRVRLNLDAGTITVLPESPAAERPRPDGAAGA